VGDQMTGAGIQFLFERFSIEQDGTESLARIALSSLLALCRRPRGDRSGNAQAGTTPIHHGEEGAIAHAGQGSAYTSDSQRPDSTLREPSSSHSRLSSPFLSPPAN
jgi:hypothetical protein